MLWIAACSGSGDSPAECVSTDVLAVIDDHTFTIEGAAEQIGGHSSPAEAVGFLLAPGLDPGWIALFVGPLIVPCADGMPMEFVESCSEVEPQCQQVVCTGDGGGWILRSWIGPDLPHVQGDWTYDDARVETSWADGSDEISFTITVDATGPGGRDWTLSGEGVLRSDAVELTYTLPALFADGEATLTFTSSPTAHEGELSVGGTVIAAVDAESSELVATGDCP